MIDFADLDNTNGTCINFSIESFNAKINSLNISTHTKNNIFILNYNIRSFNSNIDEFSTFIDELMIKPQIIVLSETWFSHSFIGNLNGYTGFDCSRQNRIGGGISIFILNSLQTKNVLCSKESSPEIEYLHITLSFNNNQVNNSIEIIGIYRPPEPTLIEPFIHKLDSILNDIDINKNIILAGDFNICSLRSDSNSTKLLDLMRSYSFIPHIHIPTRPNPHGNDSLIDQIWSNFGYNFDAGVFDDIKISDHLLNFVFLPIKNEYKKVKIRFRNHSDECINLMIDRLTNFSMFFPLLTANKDFNAKFNTFLDELDRIYKKSCPILTKVLTENKIKKPWINREIQLKIKRKHYLFQRYKNGAIPYSEFQHYQSMLSKTLKKAKKKLLQSEI